MYFIACAYAILTSRPSFRSKICRGQSQIEKFHTSHWTMARDDDNYHVLAQPELLWFNHFQFGHRPRVLDGKWIKTILQFPKTHNALSYQILTKFDGV